MKKNLLKITLASAVILTCIFAFPLVGHGATTGLDVAYRSESQVRSFIQSHPFNLNESVSYSTAPSLNEPFSAGTLSAASQQNGLNALNQMRYIAGLDANVTLNTSYANLVQKGSFVNSLNKVLSHTPARPSALNAAKYDALYNDGYSGDSRSNIGAGYSNAAHSVLYGYMEDSDSSNIDRVGHRRWCLNPKMGATAFGYVGGYTAMYAFDTSNTSATATKVAWPSQNTPLGYFATNYGWSLSVPYTVNESTVTVKVVENRTGKTWNIYKGCSASVGKLYVNNDGYGSGPAIIFTLKGLSEFRPGSNYSVTVANIKGAGTETITYKVNFMDLNPETSKWNLTKGTVSAASNYSYNGSAKKPVLTVKDSKGNNLVNGQDFILSYKNNVNAGTATVTATGKNGYSGSKTVTFKINPVSASKAVLKLSTKAYTYTGKAKNPALKVYIGSRLLKNGTDYTLKKSSGRKAVGTYSYKVTFKGNYKTSSKSITYKINPPKTKIKSLKKGKKSVTVKWTKKSSQVKGYQIRYSLKSSMKNSKNLKVKSYKKTSTTIKKLKAKKKYYVQIRTYKVVKGKTYYSAWSSKKTVKTK